MEDLVGKISKDFYLHERLSKKYVDGNHFLPNQEVLEELSFRERPTYICDWQIYTKNKQNISGKEEFFAVYDAGKYAVGGGFSTFADVENDLWAMKSYIFKAGALSRAVRHPLTDMVGSVSLMGAGTYLASQPVATTFDLLPRTAGLLALIYSGGLLFSHGISKTANRRIESKLSRFSIPAWKYRYGSDAIDHLHDCLAERRFQEE